jgi:hypothetical protein
MQLRPHPGEKAVNIRNGGRCVRAGFHSASEKCEPDAYGSPSAGFAAAMAVAAALSLLGAFAGAWLPASRRVAAAQTPQGA